MISFVVRRLASGLVLVVFVPTVSFFLVFSDGANIARNILGESATEDQVAAKAAELGLDRPIVSQYGDWLVRALHGDLGTSWFTNADVSTTLMSRAPVTLSLVVGAVLVTALISAALGTVAAVRGGWVDRVVQVISVVGFALPNFWVALVLALAFGVGLGLLPATGYTAPNVSVSAWVASIVLPVTAMTLGGMASAAQQIRGAVIDVLDQDFIRTLRSRGLSGRSIILGHALKNAAPPGLTVLSLQFIGLLSGAVVIEKVFALPGLGSLAVNSTIMGDVPAVMGVVVVTVALVVLVNLLIDLAQGWVNPKVRVQ